MIATRKNIRFIAVLMLLTGFLASNPVVGVCMPMLSDILTESHSEMNSECCDTSNQSNNQANSATESSVTHGCDCCGCGLQSDDSSLPLKQSESAVIATQIVELMSVWKTMSSSAIVSIVPDSGTWDNYPSTALSISSSAGNDTHSPPLFLLHEVFLN
jgi:hypothetical protein